MTARAGYNSNNSVLECRGHFAGHRVESGSVSQTINQMLQNFREGHESPQDFVEGHCATFAYALAGFFHDIGVPASIEVLYRSLVDGESGETSEIIFSHCVVSALNGTFDVHGGPEADEHWMSRFPTQEECQGVIYATEWDGETFGLHDHDELCATALGALAQFDYLLARETQTRMLQIYFQLITAGRKEG